MRPMMAQGRSTLSSRELGEKLGIPSAQVRKDLSWLVQSHETRQSGQAGVGYNCLALSQSVRQVIGTDRKWSTLLVGSGNIGRALLGYGGFMQDGFPITAVVDSDPRIVGKKIGGLVVAPISALTRVIRSKRIAIAILAVPRSAAQAVATQLCAAGIRGILNFAPMRISVADGVSVINIDVSVALEQLSMDILMRDQVRLSEEGAA